MRLILIIEAFSSKHLTQLNVVAQTVGISPQEIVAQLEQIDPNGKATSWLLRLLKSKQIRLPEDGHRIQEALKKFQILRPRLAVKDINQYRSLHELETTFEPLLGSGSKRSKQFRVNPLSLPGVELINQIGEYSLYAIDDADSLAELGEGTKWCTRASYPDCMADQYIDEDKVFIIAKNNSPFIQFTSDFEQIMDRNDNQVNLLNYRALLTPIEDNLLDELVDLTIVDYEPIDEPGQRKDFYTFLTTSLEDETTEPLISYILDVIGGRWVEAEPLIARHPTLAYLYTVKVLRERWLEAEPTIAKDPVAAKDYAMQIIKDRFPIAEPNIIKDSAASIVYAKYIIKGPWPAAEPNIIKDASQFYEWLGRDVRRAFYYTQFVKKSRWPKLEAIILKNQDPYWVFKYAKEIIKGPWPEAEAILDASPTWAANYADFLNEWKHKQISKSNSPS